MSVVNSNPAQARCTDTTFIMWSSLSVTCGRSVVFSGYSVFLHQLNWPTGYNWNIVESDVKHNNPHNPYPQNVSRQIQIIIIILQYTLTL